MNKQQRLHELKVRQKELLFEFEKSESITKFLKSELLKIINEINEVESELDYE